MNFNLHFGELHSDNSTNDKNSLFENCIPKCYKVKRILISFNCFLSISHNFQGVKEMVFDRLPKSSRVITLLQIYLKKTHLSSLCANNIEH